MQLTRRTALAAGAIAIAGCSGKKGAPNPRPTPASPDLLALATARSDEQKLLASYDAAIKALPIHKRAPLQVERAIHATHLAALNGTPSLTTPKHPPHDLGPTLLASARRLRRLALAATDGSNAALLASIAASHNASAR